ncbi:RNA-binding S4 domain-containing protein [Schaalia hyovaginalis]|uniref:Ribosome-associated protein n=1 Tax=Schaalia hyovaginalis TaxID=29316 RepID=A0A923E5E9_9ACTO|nr:RNA-binding S4 domain-containing protein [Schaalia hyovaginalis]MBB6334465.1 ribosome-associated protein [Schaalia hyovaginalis]MCI7671234.1 RNA-binding S4 domain-containing protein [Schaalia hyovaginalis]MDY4493171.1 RNA-binding S4 domain-containing protein [Schaalia hyovaginalis]
MSEAPVVEVSGVIRLGQFLKLANLAEDGALARELVQGGDVLVNGEVETRRGRQLADGDLVEVDSPAGRFSARVRRLD